MNQSEPSVQKSSLTPSEIVKSKFPLISDFSKVYGTSMMLEAVDISVSTDFINNYHAPKLLVMQYAYGESKVKQWIAELMITAYGLRGMSKEDAQVLEEASDVLMRMFKRESAAVFLLFMGRCKAKYYKLRYGKITEDPIIEAANDFLYKVLPALKESAYSDDYNTNRDVRRTDYWKYITLPRLWWAMRSSVQRLIDENGNKAILEAFNEEGEYSEALRCLSAISALKNGKNGKYYIDNETFNRYVEGLIPKLATKETVMEIIQHADEVLEAHVGNSSEWGLKMDAMMVMDWVRVIYYPDKYPDWKILAQSKYIHDDEERPMMYLALAKTQTTMKALRELGKEW